MTYFQVPAFIFGLLGVLLFLFLVPDPRAVGCPMPDHTNTVLALVKYHTIALLIIVIIFIERRFCSFSKIQASGQSVLIKNETEDQQLSGFGSQTFSSIESDFSLHSQEKQPNSAEREKAISFWRAVQIPVRLPVAFNIHFFVQ